MLSFDGVTKVISISAGTTTLSVPDLWSRWVDWLATSDNSKYPIAMTSIGGDTISGATKIPPYIYLQNGWKIKPQEANHTLDVTNGILLVEGGGDPFMNTTGSFIVRINYQQPVAAIASASSTSGIDEIVEGTLTMKQVLRLLVAANAGKLSGATGSTITIRDTTDSKNRITASVDANGNRTAVTLDVS